jgi:hypothetical protein
MSMERGEQGYSKIAGVASALYRDRKVLPERTASEELGDERGRLRVDVPRVPEEHTADGA